MKQIREQCDVVVNIHKADGFEERVMVIKGEPENVARAMSMVVQGIVANNEKSQGVNSTDARVLVHSMHCGAIIGKGGATIKETMANSGASLKISNEPLPGSTEKVCDIAGSPSQITSALTAVLTQLHSNPLNSGVQKVNYMSAPAMGAPAMGAPPMGAMGMGAMAANPYGEHHQQAFDAYGAPVAAAYGAPQFGGAYAQAAAQPQHDVFDTSGPPTSAELAVPTGACGAIIGKGGGTVKYINASSGCTVNLSDRGEGETRKVTIKGPKNGINVAIFLIRQAIEQQAAQTGGAGMGNTEPVTKQMTIDSAKAGLLIGKGGSTIQEIKKFSGCNIVNINTATEEDPAHRMVTIKGSPLAVQCALTIIEQKLEDTPAGASNGASTLSHLNQFNGGFSGQPEGESITVQVAIPTSMAGAVIGKGGSVVKDLKAATGCNVNIAPPTADAPEERVVTITGTRTDYAVSLIQGLVTPQ